MIITINKQQLQEKLMFASRFTLSKISSIPALQGGLITCENKKLSISTTNLKDFFYCDFKTKENFKFEAIADIKKIVDFLNLLPDDNVSLDFSEKEIRIKTKNAVGTFDLISATDFPKLKEIKGVDIELDKSKFLKFVPYVLFSSSEDESRPVLSGVKMIFQQDNVILVSTDGFRLSLIKFASSKKYDKEIIISSSLLKEVVKYLQTSKKAQMRISEDQKSVLFDFDDCTISTQSIEGEFPPFDKVIPKTHTTKISTDKSELLRNLKLAAVFAREHSNVVLLKTEKGKMTISPKTAGEKGSQMTQAAEIEGEDLKVSFNLKFLIDYLNISSDEQLGINLTTPNSPVLFTSSKLKEFLHVIMPIRMDE